MSQPYLIGAILPIAVGLMATAVGLDRDRAFYPTIMIVIAWLYPLFAVLAGSSPVPAETGVAIGFTVLAIVGFRSSLWLVVAALALHGVLDLVHGGIIANPGVPVWWPAFCGTYDIVAAGYLAFLLAKRGVPTAIR